MDIQEKRTQIRKRIAAHLREQDRLVKVFNAPSTIIAVRKAVYTQHKHLGIAIKILTGKLEKSGSYN